MAGSKLVLVSLIPQVGRVYLDREALFAGRVAPYILTGYGRTSELTREGAAAVLRTTPRDARFSFVSRRGNA